MIVFIRIVLIFVLVIVTADLILTIGYVDLWEDVPGYFRNLQKDHYLKQVFQNSPKHYKSSYRYFEKHTHELAYSGVPTPFMTKKEYLITSSCLGRWLKGIASSQKTICKHVPFNDFCNSLRMDFECMKKGCCADEYRINYANQCIKLIDLLLDVLKEQEEGVDFNTENSSYRESHDVFRHKHHPYYIDNPNKNDSPAANIIIFSRISKIDKQMEQCQHYSDTSKQQWENTIRPTIIEVASKETLNEENKTKIMGILDKVSENIKKADAEYKDIQASATLDSVQAFMEMNGW